MSKGAFVVLSYNTADLSISLAERVLETLPGWDVLIVDNDSRDAARLVEYASSRTGPVELLESGGNLGYARGNNIGLRRARAKGHRWAVVANPDVEIPDPDVVNHILDILERNSELAVVGPKIVNPLGQLQLPPLRTGHRLLFNVLYPLSGWILRRRNRSRERDPGWRRVFTVHGCFFALDLRAWELVGDFDEATFLYHEESIMADRLAGAGYGIAYAPSRHVLHQHVYAPDFRENRWDRESWNYYRREYLRAGPWLDVALTATEAWRTLLNRALDRLRAAIPTRRKT